MWDKELPPRHKIAHSISARLKEKGIADSEALRLAYNIVGDVEKSEWMKNA